MTPPPTTSFSCDFQRGDVILMDYRTLHTGLPNRGTRARPILYMVYARPWFFDDVNHMDRIPLDMPPEVRQRLAEAASGFPLALEEDLARMIQSRELRSHYGGFFFGGAKTLSRSSGSPKASATRFM